MSSKEKPKKHLTGALLTLWQLLKFTAAGIIGSLIQLLLQYILPYLFDRVRTPIPIWLHTLFHPATMFDRSTQKGAVQYATYIVDAGGVLRLTWGYFLSFFLANILVNIGLYIWNKKYTFHSYAPKSHFVIYLVIMVATILAATWFQGILYAPLYQHLGGWTRFFILIPTGLIQMLIFFFAQKLLLPADKH